MDQVDSLSVVKRQKSEYERDAGPFGRIMFVNGVISCIVNFFMFWLIIKKTPDCMKRYRLYLLNIGLWSGLFDVYMGIVYSPQLMSPAPAMCSTGLLSSSNSPLISIISFCVFVVLMGGTGMSVFSAFLFRLSTVADKAHWIHRKETIPFLIGIHMIYTLPTCVCPFLMTYLDPVGLKNDLAENYPALYQISTDRSCLFFSWKTIWTYLFFVFALIEIVLCMFVVFGLRILVMRKIEENKIMMSKRTLKLHYQLTNSLSLQFIIPELFLVLPFSLVIGLVLTENTDTRFAAIVGHSLMVLSSIHSLFNAASMIIFTGPYRRACFTPLKLLIRKSLGGGTLRTVQVHNINVAQLQDHKQQQQ